MTIIADDGKKFTNYDECMKYEQECLEKKKAEEERKNNLVKNKENRTRDLKCAYETFKNLVNAYNQDYGTKYCVDFTEMYEIFDPFWENSFGRRRIKL